MLQIFDENENFTSYITVQNYSSVHCNNLKLVVWECFNMHKHNKIAVRMLASCVNICHISFCCIASKTAQH